MGLLACNPINKSKDEYDTLSINPKAIAKEYFKEVKSTLGEFLESIGEEAAAKKVRSSKLDFDVEELKGNSTNQEFSIHYSNLDITEIDFTLRYFKSGLSSYQSKLLPVMYFEMIQAFLNSNFFKEVYNIRYNSSSYLNHFEKLFYQAKYFNLLPFYLSGHLLNKLHINPQELTSLKQYISEEYLQNLETSSNFSLLDLNLLKNLNLTSQILLDLVKEGYDSEEISFKYFQEEILNKYSMEFSDLSKVNSHQLLDLKSIVQNFIYQKQNITQNLKLVNTIFFYKKALSSGLRYLPKLEKRITERKGVKPEFIQEKNIKDSIYFKEKFTNEVLELGNKISTISINTNTKARYDNEYSDGVFICSVNDHHSPNEKLDFSSVLWRQYKLMKDKYPNKVGSIEKILRNSITNEETIAVIHLALNQGKFPQRIVSPRDLDLWTALLGTPNGRSAVWLCHDYLEELNNRSPKKIKVFKKEGFYHMMIFLE